ncbi:MAG: glycosyltransferase family 39 protein [Candidatus Erginobacter occultus]|nr:glycosyltransferase family 39 protein [Candidatus Erginobacter occultus]
MPVPPSLVDSPSFLPALIGFVLLTAGLLLRREKPPWRRGEIVPFLGFAVLFLLGFALILHHASRTAFQAGGAVPALNPVLRAANEAAWSIQEFFGDRLQTLTAGGAILLLVLGVISLIRGRPAFFWCGLALVCGVRAESHISAGESSPARWLYLLAVISALLGAVWTGRKREREVKWPPSSPLAVLAILAVLNLALGFHALDRNPRFDEFEATNALAAVQFLEGSQPTREMIWSYFPRSYGADSSTSALFTIPAAFLMRLGGVNLVAFRAGSVFWAVVSVFLIYLLGRSLIGGTAGITAAILLSFSSWHLTIYRAGMFGSMSIAFTLLVLLLLLKAVQSGMFVIYLALGFLLSFNHFFYLPTRFLVPLAAAVLIHRCVFYRGFFRRDWAGMTVFAGVFAVFFLLQAGNIRMVADTAYTSSKGGSVYPFIGSQSRADMSIRWELVPGQLLENLDILYRNLCRSRDSGSFTYPPERGLLNRAAFLLALLGLGWSLGNWKRTRGAVLLLWLVPALGPFMLLVRPIGSVPRHLILGIPLAALLAGAFLQETGRSLADIFADRLRRIAAATGILFLAIFLGLIGLFGLERFFNREEPDLTAIGRLSDTLLREGYRLSIHFHHSLNQLGPGRVADFLSYPATGRLHRHRTTINRYYDYREVVPDPWRQYRAGEKGMREFLEEHRETGQAAAVIGEVSNRDAIRRVVEEFSPGSEPRELTGLDGQPAGYYFLLEGEPLVME